MSFNGAGVYTLPGAQLANGATVSATENNQFRNDVATALNVAWTRDGQAPATANIPMGSHKFTGLAAGTGAGDSVRFEQLPSPTNKLDLTTSVTGTLPVTNGGSGAATLTGILKGNGTSAFSAAAAGTDYLAPAAIGTTVQAYAAELQGATQGGFNGMKNRIINGAMMIDQRNAGASVSISANAYTLDRMLSLASGGGVYTVQQSSTVPSATGFRNSAIYTVTTPDSSIAATDYYGFDQRIEGYNVADLNFGNSGAIPFTVSFWVRSSVTGTYSFALFNNAADRSYVTTYTINSANTWEQKSITITPDTSGTWDTTNAIGVACRFALGAGSTYTTSTLNSWQAGLYFNANTAANWIATNGATFYITGVQLEKGSTATSFDYRPYGTELALCQRYYWRVSGITKTVCNSANYSATNAYGVIKYPTTMRSTPSLDISGVADLIVYANGGTTTSSNVAIDAISTEQSAEINITTSGLNAGQASFVRTKSTGSPYIGFASEL